MRTGWIEIAMENGARLIVYPVPRNCFEAQMYWPNNQKVTGQRMSEIQDEIDMLDEALCNDAAQELFRQGGA